MKKQKQNITLSNATRLVPIINIRHHADDEWSRLAYRNRLERQVGANDK